ncbi:MAG TPA: PIG-L family deacetylase [Terriglobia bacterium]|nr:PIG-L family deacetylase [Terriglobia bacterium]
MSSETKIRFRLPWVACAVAATFIWLSPGITRVMQLRAQIPQASPSPKPDDRFKTDILVIVAHPDDETMVTGYLARAIYDEHKRVAVIFGTRGNGGGNAVGWEQSESLGEIRKIEARKALEYFGVMNVWFLNGPDTPSQNVLWSLETWNHGQALDEAVRLVRLTRPEVILTWLPDYVAGENHGDHQAAGVIATEAFDMAGDPTKFPEQLAAPRNRTGIANLTEGLRPWQPKKLYYFSDASHTRFLENRGPSYATTGISPSRHEPYYRLKAEEMKFHLTQDDTGMMASKALESGDMDYFKQPELLVLGKSLVGGSVTGDIFEGIKPGPIPFARVPGYQPESHRGVWIELGGSWAFYHEFWKAQGIEQIAKLLSQPEVSVGAGNTLYIPLVIHNDTAEDADVTLTITASSPLKEGFGSARYPVRAHDVYPVETGVEVPPGMASGWKQVSFKAGSGNQSVGDISVRVQVGSGGLPE